MSIALQKKIVFVRFVSRCKSRLCAKGSSKLLDLQIRFLGYLAIYHHHLNSCFNTLQGLWKLHRELSEIQNGMNCMEYMSEKLKYVVFWYGKSCLTHCHAWKSLHSAPTWHCVGTQPPSFAIPRPIHRYMKEGETKTSRNRVTPSQKTRTKQQKHHKTTKDPTQATQTNTQGLARRQRWESETVKHPGSHVLFSSKKGDVADASDLISVVGEREKKFPFTSRTNPKCSYFPDEGPGSKVRHTTCQRYITAASIFLYETHKWSKSLIVWSNKIRPSASKSSKGFLPAPAYES